MKINTLIQKMLSEYALKKVFGTKFIINQNSVAAFHITTNKIPCCYLFLAVICLPGSARILMRQFQYEVFSLIDGPVSLFHLHEMAMK